MATPQPQMVCSCDSLPAEKLLEELEKTALQELASLIRACPRVGAIFTPHRRQVVVTALVKSLGPSIVDALTFQEMYELYQSTESPGQLACPTGLYARLTAGYPDGINSMLGGMSDGKLNRLCQLTREAQAIAELFATIWRASLISPYSGQRGTLPRVGRLDEAVFAPLSDMERRRLVQAFFSIRSA